MSRIFLSHSSIDNFAAIALRDWLASEGWDDVFLDLDAERGIAAGERWERALHEAATRCEAVIFLVSENWLGSGWCLKEYALARGLNKKLFAALIAPDKNIANLPPELRGTWQVVDLTGGQETRIIRVPLPGSHEEKHVTFAEEGLRRLKKGLEKAGLDPKFFAWPPEQERDRAPFRGLKPLDGVDAGIFFGRDAPIVEATDRLRGLRAAAAPRILVILGASGAGKSSFLRAGLLPRLARDDSHFLPLPVIRPERAALFGDNGLLGALEAVLPTRTRAEIRAAIRAGAASVGSLLAGLADGAFRRTLAGEETAKPPVIVIAVDQAEELLRTDGAEEGAALLELLRDLTAADEPAVIALFAIRSDAYDGLEHAKALEGLPQHTLPLLPMPRSAYKEVIEGPARRFVEGGGRLSLEPQLTLRLLEDLDRGAGSDALPLLAFTLEQLYLEYRRAGALRLVDYEAFGGLKGAIDAAVERAFARADTDARIPRDRQAREALLRRGLVPWLAGIDPDSRNPRRNIARRADIPSEAEPLIDLLVEERLLASDTALVKDPATGIDTRIATIEPAHEALLRQWGLLQGWLEEDFGRLATLEGVKRAARDWDANGGADAWLAHQAQRLAEAQALDERPDIAAKLDRIDRAYLAQCRARQEAAHAAEEARRREREEEQALRLAAAEALAAANRRTARRTRIGLAVALALAAAAGLFGFEALREKAIANQKTREAQAQTDRADRALRAATETANGLVFDLAQRFRNAVGMPTSVVRDILDRALRLQDQLSNSGEASSELAQSRAVALAETATTLLMVGDTPGALEAALKSHQIWQDLVRQQPDNVGWRRNLAVSLGKVGEAKLRAGDQAGALEAYEESLAIAQDLAKDKRNTEGARDLSVGLNNIGDVKLQAGDRAGALAAYEESLAIRRELAKDKSSAPAQRDLSVGLQKVAEVKLRAGDLTAALAAYEESLAIDRELANDKNNAEAQRDLSVSLSKMGNMKLRTADLAGALAAYAEELAIDRYLAADKSNAQAQRDLSVSLENVGDVKLQAGDQAGALAAYQESLAIRRDLARDVKDAQAQRDLSISLQNVGDVQLQAGDQAGALAAYEEGLAIRRNLAKDEHNAAARRDLAVNLQRIGNVKLRAGDQAGALAAYEESLGISREFAKDKNNAQAQRDLSVILSRIGDVKLQAGDQANAVAAYEESLAIARELAKDRRNAEAQRDLSVSLIKIGDVKLRAGDLAGALAAYEASLAIVRDLAGDKNNAQARRDLSVVLEKVGDVRLRAGDQAGALIAYTENLAIARGLAQDKLNAEAQRDLSVSLNKFGDVKLRQGDLRDALAAFEEGLAIARELARATRVGQAQRDLSVSLERVGDAKLRAGDQAGGLSALQESLALRREFAKDKNNAVAQFDVVASLYKLANAGDEPSSRLTEALAILKDLDSAGRLPPDHKGWIAIIENALAKAKQASNDAPGK